MYRFVRTTLCACALAVMLCACSPRAPVTIGFLGSLSGPAADLGSEGLCGVRLAVELRNQEGGLHGRPITLVEADDGQDPQQARRAVDSLIDRKVFAIVGPMTSAVAVAIQAPINTARVVAISPTASSEDLSGLDDHFFRIIPSTRHFAKQSARYYAALPGLRRVQPIVDRQNSEFTASWLRDFSAAFGEAGGTVLPPVAFDRSLAPDFTQLSRQALQSHSDLILILTDPAGTAMLADALHTLDPAVRLGTNEGVATRRLVELGGESVEGMIVPQLMTPDSESPRYEAFRRAYAIRFGRSPEYGALYAFEAANVLFAALERQQSGQTLKESLLSPTPFAGIERTIQFDASGDTTGDVRLTVLRNGKFTPISP